MQALDVAVDATQDRDPPWAYRSVTLHFRVVCDGLTVPVMSRVIRLSMVRYCSVITTISGVAAVAATVELVGTDDVTTGRIPIELALPAATLAIEIDPVSDLEPDLEPVGDEDE
jgi:hypothetical protein